jgi:hypothetical protein
MVAIASENNVAAVTGSPTEHYAEIWKAWES